ncbi:DsbA family protein [Humitalea sp. 24SJ18S-53]|uniref:DsbA family protein n=1 Tax=Humitalea sp. 24SJ18S-53 TaxID=3422307 RepID=UPI003D665BFA
MTQATYLFDPLCGWCYGAAPALRALAETPGIDLDLVPTGLFSGAGARPMDDGFAAYAWTNDQRIEKLTGQPFSTAYRDQVLADRTRAFDSGPATLALVAMALTKPEQVRPALQAIQHARYVEGRDVTDLGVLAALGLDAVPDAALRAATAARTARAQALMRSVGAQGVPSLVVTTGGVPRLVPGSLLFGPPQTLVAQLQAT